MASIPTKVNRYNLYDDGERLFGNGDELTLPDLEMSSETLAGAGILGEIDDPTMGYFSNLSMEIPFRVLDKEAANMMNMATARTITIRGANQVTDSEGNINYTAIRVVVRGRVAKLSLGKMKAGSPMDSAITLNLTYIMIELDGTRIFELDKLNEVFKINGVDMLKTIKEMC